MYSFFIIFPSNIERDFNTITKIEDDYSNVRIISEIERKLHGNKEQEKTTLASIMAKNKSIKKKVICIYDSDSEDESTK